jgi:hypothetical protein
MLGVFKVHTVTVETYTGPTSTGDGYAAPVDVLGFLDEGLVRVKNSQGEELVEQSRFYAEVADAAKFRPESKVTLPDGRVAQVDRARIRQAGGLFALVEHVEVILS